jgi:hypothetical protein
LTQLGPLQVPAEQLERMLSIEEANQFLKRLEEKHK